MESIIEKTGQLSILEISIDGRWYSEDIVNLIDATTRLYIFHLMTDVYFLPHLMQLFGNKRAILPPEAKRMYQEPYLQACKKILTDGREYDDIEYPAISLENELDINLRIKSIQYASPGSVDLVGLGKIFETLKECLFHYFPSAERKTDIEMKQKEIALKEREIALKEQEIIAKKIENYSRMGFSYSDIQILLGLEYSQIKKLKNLIESEKVVNLNIVNEAS